MIEEMFGLHGRVAVVTGAGRGIGEGIAKVLSGAGAAVVCAARRTAEIERVAAEIREAGGRAIAVTTDVTDLAAVEALAEAAIAEWGRIDVWVNNAGGSPVQAPLTELPESEWRATFELNLTAVWTCTRVAAAKLEDDGSIVNISSVAGEVPVVGSGHYSAAKAGVNMLTKVFAQELAPRLRVNCLMPGVVPTEILMTSLNLQEEDLPGLVKAFRIPLGKLGKPDDLGAAVLYLSSPAGAWVTGQCIRISGGS